MAILLGALVVALVIYAAVVSHCWWIIPVAALAAGIAWGSWYYAKRLTPARLRSWFRRNGARLLRAIMLAAIATVVVAIIWSLWQNLPDCRNGCGGSISASSVDPLYSTNGKPFVVEKGQSVLVTAPLDHELEWAREDNRTSYQFMTQNGVLHTRKPGPVPTTNHGIVSSVILINSLEKGPIAIRVRAVPILKG